MPTISHKELRDKVRDVLRRVEAGEQFIVTVAGRPAAQLGPTPERQWVGAAQMRHVWETPAPASHGDDLGAFPAALTDPFT